MSDNPYRGKTLERAIELALEGHGTEDDFVEAGFPADAFPTTAPTVPENDTDEAPEDPEDDTDRDGAILSPEEIQDIISPSDDTEEE